MGRFYKEYFFRPWPFCHDGDGLKRILWLFLCAAWGFIGIRAMDVPAALCVSLSPDCPAAHVSGLESKSAFISIIFHAVVGSSTGYYHECFYVEMDQEKAL